MRVEQLDASIRPTLSKLRSATARATQICDCLVLSSEDLEECAEENPRLVPLIMKRLHNQPDRSSDSKLLASAARAGAPSFGVPNGSGRDGEEAPLPNSHMAAFRAQLERQSNDIREIKAALASVAAALPLASTTPAAAAARKDQPEMLRAHASPAVRAASARLRMPHDADAGGLPPRAPALSRSVARAPQV